MTRFLVQGAVAVAAAVGLLLMLAFAPEWLAAISWAVAGGLAIKSALRPSRHTIVPVRRPHGVLRDKAPDPALVGVARDWRASRVR